MVGTKLYLKNEIKIDQLATSKHKNRAPLTDSILRNITVNIRSTLRLKLLIHDPIYLIGVTRSVRPSCFQFNFVIKLIAWNCYIRLGT